MGIEIKKNPVSDNSYGASWNGDTSIAPSKNAVYDEIELIASGNISTTAITDPAINAAVSTAIVDAYGGVVITTTAAGNAQTIQDPTAITVNKDFIVANNDTSTDSITVNSVVIAVGEAQKFFWDGSAWLTLEAVSANQISFTPTGDIAATNVQAAIAEIDTEKLANVVEDTTPQLGGDLDGQGNYAFDVQNLQDMQADGAGYWFDGVDDYINVADNANLDFGTGDFSAIAVGNFDSGGANSRILYKRLGAAAGWGLTISSNNYLALIFDDDVGIINGTEFGSTDLYTRESTTIAVSFDRTGNATAYLNGVQEGIVDISSISASIDNAIDFYVMGETTAWTQGEMYKTLLFNLALDNDDPEDQAIINGGPVPYKYLGASQDEKIANGGFDADTDWTKESTWTIAGGLGVATDVTDTSDIYQDSVLTAGKLYRITFTVSGYSIGGVAPGTGGNYGTTRTADGTYTETLIATSARFRMRAIGVATTLNIDDVSVVQIGQVAGYTQDGVTDTTWKEVEGRTDLDGTVSGAKAFNLPRQKVVQQNLLTNSQWIANSNSTLENVGSDLVTNGDFTTDTTGWTVFEAGGTISSISSEGVVEYVSGVASYLQNITVVSGKIYRLSVDLIGGTAATKQFYYTVGGVELGLSLAVGTNTVIFEAGNTNCTVKMRVPAVGTGIYDNITLYEVTPGYVAADNLGPDGWAKTSTIDLYRQHNDITYTKGGSFYSLKVVTPATAVELTWDELGRYNEKDFYYKFAGRTVTLGAWIYADTTNQARLGIRTSAASTYSDYHTGTAGWEWLEVSVAVPASITSFYVAFRGESVAGTYYISQPMLVFGDKIGVGNYSSPPGEIICEQGIRVSTNAAVLAADDKVQNLEVMSEGKIGKGAKAIRVHMRVQDSAVANEEGISWNKSSSDPVGITLLPQVNNMTVSDSGVIPCDSNGDIYQHVGVSGDTLSNFDVWIYGVII